VQADSKSVTIGNACLIGQIATFIESLHLSYEEVIYKIPYRVLLIMQKDKVHTVYGQRVRRVSGREMAARKRQQRQEAQQGKRG
jgi:hypothetical protein